jgi:type III restriction enzyme
MAFLHEKIVAMKLAKKNHYRTRQSPIAITDNLKPAFSHKTLSNRSLSTAHSVCYAENDLTAKTGKTAYHLLYNMATGSGKTLIMAGLMLYLYEQGHRNFLFFVNSNNIIQKTKANFLNAVNRKYLFNKKIVIGGKEIIIKEIDNFEEADTQNINIKFTTIQQLHLDLNNTQRKRLNVRGF